MSMAAADVSLLQSSAHIYMGLAVPPRGWTAPWIYGCFLVTRLLHCLCGGGVGACQS